MKRSRTNIACAVVLCATLSIVYFFGAFDHLMEKSFTHEFDYPLNVNIRPLAEQVRFGMETDVSPINYYNHAFLSRCGHKCAGDAGPRLLILVKSAMAHFERRAVIRRTWGSERRFPGLTVRTVFVLGVERVPEGDLQQRVDRETRADNDIVQAQFVDSYYNNTIKTMIAFRWAFEFCPSADFYLFADDDMFVSVSNALRFVEGPTHYPSTAAERHRRALDALPVGIVDQSLADGMHVVLAPYANYSTVMRALRTARKIDTSGLFAGFVFNSSPHRHLSSKWRVSLEEYPYDMWPPYITAGAYILSNEALKTMYAGSMFVKHFRFDDIYLGIVAMKVGVIPFHCNEFYFYKKPYEPKKYDDLIASHGYHDPDELQRIWSLQLTRNKV